MSSCPSGSSRGTYASSCLLAPARKPDDPSRSRVAAFGRLFEGTDEISLGQTRFSRSRIRLIVHMRHHPTPDSLEGLINVAELLAPGNKPVSFCQGHLRRDGAKRTSEDGRPTASPRCFRPL